MVENCILTFFTVVSEAWGELFEIEILHLFLGTEIVDSSLGSYILLACSTTLRQCMSVTPHDESFDRNSEQYK